jgi:hypothetical protein
MKFWAFFVAWWVILTAGAAEDWLHFSFAIEGLQLKIDGKLWPLKENNQNTFSHVITAQPLWINLTSLDPQRPLRSTDRVHVMLLNYRYTSGRQIVQNTSERIIEIDLDYTEGEYDGKRGPRFTGQVPPIMVERAYLPGHQIQETFWQEVVFWVNGDLYKDFEHQHNFVFNMAETARCMRLLR